MLPKNQLKLKVKLFSVKFRFRNLKKAYPARNNVIRRVDRKNPCRFLGSEEPIN